MSGPKKILLLIVGALAALLVVSQLVLGLLLINGRGELKMAHQHTGYTTVVVALIYIGWSLMTLASLPTRPKE